MSDTKLLKQLTDIAQSTQSNSGKFNDLLNSDKTRALTSESKFSKSQGFVLNTDIFNLSQRTSTTVSPPTFFDPEIQQIDSCDFTRYNRKMKERRIWDIVELVTLWRKLYNGIPDNKGNLLRYSLDDAARKVKVSKKSLDDYLLQLRFGRKLGFDFEKHKNDRVGVLRKFVKLNKSQVKIKH